MVDQNSQFYAILTKVGAAKQANADALGIPWKITHMAVGDASPAGLDNPPLPMPDASWTSLLNEWRRAPLNQLKVDEKDSAVIVAEQVIPAEIGGRWIREVGLYDADGDLVAVANCAPTYKPLLNQGSGRTQVVRMNLVVSSSSNVVLKIDPSVVLATREWVTEELAWQDFKHSVLAATTSAITLSGLQTVDGVTLTAGARVLVKNQAAAKDNGLYLVVAGGAWTRCPDADTSAKVTPGLLVLVERGTANGDSAWQLITDAPITLGVTALVFEMAFGRTGVFAGTYRSVTVDAYGRVTAATNPTTVAGYGLTDVLTTTQVNNALALKAPLASPVFTGDPKAPTPVVTDNDASIATTAFVRQVLARYGLAAGAYKYSGDFDSIVETGTYNIDNLNTGTRPKNPTNGQDLLNAVILHVEKDSTLAFQIWESNSSITSYPFYRSKMSGGSWTPWGQMWNSLNTPKQTDPLDLTPGAMLTVGSFGWGGAAVNYTGDIDIIAASGLYMVSASTSGSKPNYPPRHGVGLIPNGTILHLERGSSQMATQVWDSLVSSIYPITCIRTRNSRGEWSPWREVLTSGTIATQPQVDSGTADDVIVTPKKMRWGVSFSATPNGWLALPSWLGGFVFQWGTDLGIAGASKSLIFPMAFPSQLFSITGTTSGTSAAGISVLFNPENMSKNSITFRCNNSSNVTVANAVFWFAVGK